MSKRNGYLILGIVFLAFTIIAFAAPCFKTPVFWTAYLFGIIAICFQVPLWNKAFSVETLKSRFLGYSVIYIGIIYLIVQIIISLIMMAIPKIPVFIAIIINTIILAIVCTLFLSGNMANTAIKKNEEKVQTKTEFIKGIQMSIDILLSEETDLEVKRELKKIADVIRYSDPMSNSGLEDIEKQIADRIAAVSSAGNGKLNLISEINELIKQRNIKCRALK